MQEYPPEYDQEKTKQHLLDTWDSVPVWKDCPDCQGHGTFI
jgi:hypothetical protein